jgi:hypothetical protein
MLKSNELKILAFLLCGLIMGSTQAQVIKKKDLKDPQIKWTLEQVHRTDTSSVKVLEIKDSSLVYLGLKLFSPGYKYLPEKLRTSVNSSIYISHKNGKVVKVSQLEYSLYFHNNALIYAKAPCHQFVGWGYCNGEAYGSYQWFWQDNKIYKLFSGQQDMDRCSCFLSEEPVNSFNKLFMPIFMELLED